MAESISNKLSYFNALDHLRHVSTTALWFWNFFIYNLASSFIRLKCWQKNLSCFQKLNSPTVSVTSESFVPMLARLDECISFISSNVSYFFPYWLLFLPQMHLYMLTRYYFLSFKFDWLLINLTVVLGLGWVKVSKILFLPITQTPYWCYMYIVLLLVCLCLFFFTVLFPFAFVHLHV